ncbi:unnamed protein product [Closterium sp. Yama58-4]|nr:unnamed protein product [Closterium sp. Yama58-4]
MGVSTTVDPSPAPPAPPSDVSGNSLYGRINCNFKSMVADGDALINLAHNFFFGDSLLLAAGCQVCPSFLFGSNQCSCDILLPSSSAVSSLSTGAIVGIAVGCFAGFILLAAVLTWLL